MNYIYYLAIEELFDELLNFENASRTANENNFIDLILLQVSIFQDLLNGLQSGAEKVLQKKQIDMNQEFYSNE